MFEKSIEFFKEILGEENVLIDEPMKKHTSFKIGGPVDAFLIPSDEHSLARVLKECTKENIRFMVIGNGTNLLVGDKGLRGVVIKLYKNFSRCEVGDDIIEARAGMLLSNIAQAAYRNSLAGFEFAAGIPGTLGGAITMNAGAYHGEMKDVIIQTDCVDKNGNFITLMGDEHEFGYRTSRIQKERFVVLKSKIKLKKGEKEDIKFLMDDLNGRRSDKQPLEMPSAGSVFKRPVGHYAGKLIREAGLQGYEIGGAQVSLKHCGFIVNTGNATAKDVIDLIMYIQNTVKEKFGVELEPEVRLIGEC